MVKDPMKMWRLNEFGYHSTLFTDTCSFTHRTTSLCYEAGGAVRQKSWLRLSSGFLYDFPVPLERCYSPVEQSGVLFTVRPAQSWILAVGSSGLFLVPWWSQMLEQGHAVSLPGVFGEALV